MANPQLRGQGAGGGGRGGAYLVAVVQDVAGAVPGGGHGGARAAHALLRVRAARARHAARGAALVHLRGGTLASLAVSLSQRLVAILLLFI